MSPLLIQTDNEWKIFCDNINTIRKSLKGTVKKLTISSDIWWGLVQKSSSDKYDWSYYDRLSYTLLCLSKEEPLLPEILWAPIMSFHQCGGNVGDDVYIEIPRWAIEGREFISDKGNRCSEYVSFWYDSEVTEHYTSFIRNFVNRYSNNYYSDYFKKICNSPKITEINVSCGPAGELRYPSYNSHDNYKYPEYGNIQSKDPQAKKSFFSLYKQQEAIINSEYIKHNYRNNNNFVRLYLRWYSNELVRHGQRMIQIALNAIDQTNLFDCRIGIKIPGIHWNSVKNLKYPRLSEIFAGLIYIEEDTLFSNFNNDDIESGYTRLVWALSQPEDMIEEFISKDNKHKSLIQNFSKKESNPLYIKKGYKMPKSKYNITRKALDLNIHFTCAEMPSLISKDIIYDNENRLGMTEWYRSSINSNQTEINPYSKPKALVKHLAWCGQQIPDYLGVQMGVENALSSLSFDKWENIKSVINKKGYGELFNIPDKYNKEPFSMINILRANDAALFSRSYKEALESMNN